MRIFVGGENSNKPLGIAHVSAAGSFSTTGEHRVPILEKAANEDLTIRQTRKVTKAIVQAKTPEEKQAILETPIVITNRL